MVRKPIDIKSGKIRLKKGPKVSLDPSYGPLVFPKPGFCSVSPVFPNNIGFPQISIPQRRIEQEQGRNHSILTNQKCLIRTEAAGLIPRLLPARKSVLPLPDLPDLIPPT